MDARAVLVGPEEVSTPNVVQRLYDLVEQHGADRVKLVDCAPKANEMLWMGWEVDGRIYKVYQFNEKDELIVGGLTPEQAVAATLKDSTCTLKPDSHDAADGSHFQGFICTACNRRLGVLGDGLLASFRLFKYCPMCGRRIEREDA